MDIKALAMLGAYLRLAEIAKERAEILKMFPGSGQPDAVIVPAEETPAPTHRRKRMSAKDRKAIGVRMRRFWRAKRKAKKK